MELLATYLDLPRLALVASRLGGLLMFQPVLGTLAVPYVVRALLVLGLAVLLSPFAPLPPPAPASPAALAVAAAGEVALGLLIGTVVMACFVGLELGGLLIAQESGLAFGQIVDPSSNDEQSILSAFYLQLGIVVYLTIGGHRALVAACLDTFDTIPLLGGSLALLDPQVLVEGLTLGCATAVRVAAPAVITLFLVNIALGFVSRTLPQLNVTTVGFALKGLIAFALIAASLPTALDVFADDLERVVGWIAGLVAAPPGPGATP